MNHPYETEGRLPISETPRTETEAKLQELGKEYENITRGLVSESPIIEGWARGEKLGETIDNPDGSVGMKDVRLSERKLSSAKWGVKRLQEILEEIERLQVPDSQINPDPYKEKEA
jgi:hypothetical protein